MPRGEGVTPDELIADLQRVAEEIGRPPTSSEYDRRGNWSPSAVNNTIGRWHRALEEAGLDPREADYSHRCYALEAMDPEDAGLSPEGDVPQS